MQHAVHIIANSIDPKRGGLEESVLRIAAHISKHPQGAQVFLYSREPSSSGLLDLPGPVEFLSSRRNLLLEPVAHVKHTHLKHRLDTSLFRTLVYRRIKKLLDLNHSIISFYASSAGFVAQHVAANLRVPHITSDCPSSRPERPQQSRRWSGPRGWRPSSAVGCVRKRC